MLIFVLLFVFAASALTFILARSIFSNIEALASLKASKQSFMTAESLAEDVAHRKVSGFYSVNAVEQLVYAHATATATTTTDFVNDVISIDVKSDLQNRIRKSRIELSAGAGTAFNYGLQSGTGGVTMSNSASVIGNIFSNGTIIGSTGGGTKSEVAGDVVSAGPGGYINSVHATGSAWAHTIEDSTVDGDLNVASAGDDISNFVVGARNYGVSDQLEADLPISTTTIEEWKQAVIDYGTVIASTSEDCEYSSSGTYKIEDPATIGYLKVECNMDIVDTGSPPTTVTLTGPVWVEGNLSFTQGPVMNVDPSLGRFSVQMIADNESDRLTSSKIEIRNTTEFNGSGDDRSLVMLLSMNESASQGGGQVAIDVSQKAEGDIMVYAGDGLIDIGNGIELKEVTAYQINIAQNSDIIYESGLASLLFTSGPGGGYVVSDWTETY